MDKPGTVGQVGAILNIVGGVISIMFIFGIFAIYYNVKYLRTGQSQTGAAVWGVLFGGVIGGILVAIDKG